MLQNLPYTILKGILSFTTENIEKHLLKEESKLFSGDKWKRENLDNGLFIDLSQIRWVNISAATQLAIFVESAKKAGIDVYIALPIKQLTTEELQSNRYVHSVKESNRRKREEVNKFLKLIQFDRAVKCEHITSSAKVILSEDYEFTSKSPDEFFRAFAQEYHVEQPHTDFGLYHYRYIVPMTWIDSSSQQTLSDELATAFQEVLSDDTRGLHHIDILSIKNVICSELIKNVREHAGEHTKFALMSVGLMPSRTITGKKDESFLSFVNPVESEYIKWLKTNKVENFIEFYFGDSGTGLIGDALIKSYENSVKSNKKHADTSKLKNLDVLKWAFNKWSTRKTEEVIRGTKGLYRINRIVNKYNGLFLIRTGNLYGGFQKGGYSASQWIDNSKIKSFKFPGTFIQLKLCPYKEVTRFNFKFKKTPGLKEWNTLRYEITENSTGTFQNWITRKTDFSSGSNLMLILKIRHGLTLEKTNEFLSYALKQLSYLRHPNGVVIYIVDSTGKELLEAIADSTNEMLKQSDPHPESKDPDHELVYDPILIIGKNSSINWFGGDQKIIDLLNELYLSENKIRNIKELSSYRKLTEQDQESILLSFQNDDSIICINENFEIEFNFTNIDDFFLKKLQDSLKSIETGEELTCIPTLKTVKRWIPVQRILNSKDVVGYALAMYLKVVNDFNEIQNLSKTYILIDHNQQLELAFEFAKLSGIDPRNVISIMDDIDNSIPRRTMLFSKEDRVIILTTIISSSETIRRLVKYAKRDMAEVLFILCLANFRETSVSMLQTWGENTPIYSLFEESTPKHAATDLRQKNTEEALAGFNKSYQKLTSSKTFYSPAYEIENPQVEQGAIAPDLKDHIISTRSLHYNHIGRYNGRHFTFYIDKKSILEKHTFIWQKCEDTISEWVIENNISDFTLVTPEFSRDFATSLDNCVNHLKEKFKVKSQLRWNSDKPNNIQLSGKNLIYIDFGALTGSSINKLLSSVKNVENILFTIIFSQFKNKENEFYEKIKTIDIERTQNSKFNQISLFDMKNQDEKKKIAQSSKLDIKFLYNLPFVYYNSTTCPICEHERAIESFKVQDEYMLLFANDRKKRLKIKEKNILESYPSDYYASSGIQNSELSSIQIMKMYEFRNLLNEALTSTRTRIKVFSFTLNILNNLQKQIKDQDSDLYALLYLISTEVNWLQKEPLVFREIRNMISEIAFSVATLDLHNLVEVFEAGKLYNCSADKLAVRYKYSAITVLRSSNKLRFCESISEIINSSTYKGVLSNNLAQNTFYHINSLHFNLYNKSLEYFEKLEQDIKKINEGKLNIVQRASLLTIKTNNLSIIRGLQWEGKNNRSSRNIIKSLKNEFTHLYGDKSHPAHYETFQSLDFRALDEKALADLNLKRIGSAYYRSFESKRKNLLTSWELVSQTLEPLIKSYTDKLPATLYQSEIFKQYYFQEKILNIFGQFHRYGLAQKFKNYILKISEDLFYLIPKYDEYHQIYDEIYHTIIKYKKNEQEDSEDSILLNFLSNFPSDLKESVGSIFGPHEFPKLAMDITADASLVYYPSNTLLNYLRHIRNNILERLAVGLSLADIDIRIRSEREMVDEQAFIKVSISYSGTVAKRKNDNGGLQQFSADLKLFDGHLEHYNKDNEYHINISFLSYA